MKVVRYLLIMAMLYTGVAYADGNKPVVLSDHELAGVKGGFCILEICESGPGTGICQPVAPTHAAICGVSKCFYQEKYEYGVLEYGCIIAGKYTCTEPGTYRQCVLAFKLSTCSNGPNPLKCGVIVEPTCHWTGRECICDAEVLATPYDWTDCI